MTRNLFVFVAFVLICVPLRGQTVVLSEAGGESDVVVRVDGRVIALNAGETRTVQLQGGGEPHVDVIRGNGNVTVNGASLRRRAVRPPAQRPSSFELIDQALAGGAIDSETALRYRVYSLFGDARLPLQYQGDDSAVSDSLYMAEVRDRFASLSEATQADVQPFLVPPVYQGHTATVSTMATPPPCQFFSDSWGWVDTSNGFVRVWYRLDSPDAEHARHLAAMIDSTIWPAIAGLMSRLPVSDLGYDCEGSTGRYDIYLDDVPNSVTIPMKECDHKGRPAFTRLKRTSPDALAAHEMFHEFQYAYPLAGCISDDNYRWWAESSAQWAQDFVFPKDQSEQSAASLFLDVPEKSLDFNDSGHEYGAYLLPFYVYRSTGNAGFIDQAWQKSATQPALEALDQALFGGFAAVWPEFVKDNWNRKPLDDYAKWDGLAQGAMPPGGPGARPMTAAPDYALPLNVDLPRLSATYKYFTFDDSVSSVVFWNGVTQKLALKDEPLSGVQYATDPATDDEKRGAHITALMKIGGSWKSDDWTNRRYAAFCRDVAAERIEELVLIISNSEYRDRGRKLVPPGLAPVVFVSNIGCWRWKGTAKYTADVAYQKTTVSAAMTWTRDAAASAPTIRYSAGGSADWTIELTSPNGGRCVASGTIPVSDLYLLTSYNYAPAEGSFHRAYYASSAPVETVHACGGDLAVLPFVQFPPLPVIPGLPDSRILTVSADGRTMDGSYTPSSSPYATWTWHFVAQKE